MRRTIFWNLRWAWWLSVLTLTACSGLPRIIVLHDPLTPEEHATLGGRYEAQGLTKQATEEYHAALRKQPDNLPALIGLGNLSYEQGKMKDAERYYRKALDRDPNHPMANNNLASVYLTLGKNLEEAERLARLALAQQSPHEAYFWETLAGIHLQQGHLAEAQADLILADSTAPAEDQALKEKIAQTNKQITEALERKPHPND
jgi:Tfp pilus assembly protein PilF